MEQNNKLLCLFYILNQHQDTGIFDNILLGLEYGKQYKYFKQRKWKNNEKTSFYPF